MKKLTKQIISAALGAVTAASCGTMAFAADKTLNQDTPSGSSTVEYAEESTYTASIPEYIKVQKMSEDVDTNANSVTLRDVVIPDGKSLVGTVTYNGVVAEENNVKIPYKLATAKGDLTSGSEIITQVSGKSTEEKTSNFGAVATESPKYSGYYTDTATFSFDEVGVVNTFFERVKANNYTLNIGKTKPNYVVAKFNNDFTEVTISKNGNDSDGLMQDGAFVEIGTGDVANYPLESILEKAEILDGVKNIGDSTFKSCKALTSVAIPDSVTSIGSEAFRDCYNLESAKIPVGVTEIKYAAFFSCQRFKSIEIPDTVTTVSDTAFGDCKGLTSITIPKNVTNISPRAFFCSSKLSNINVAEENENYSSVNGVLFTKDKTSLVCYPEGKNDGSYTVPNGVTNIGDYAFQQNSLLKNITIPNTVTDIGRFAFDYCSSLSEVTIPNSVTSIGDSAFSGCTLLTSATISDKVTSINDYTFKGCSSLAKVNIPNGVTSIGKQAFDSCTTLTSVTIPDSVSSLGIQSFNNCTSLKSITIPKGVTRIGDYAFSNCSSLTEANLHNNVTEIGKGSFQACSSLTGIVIPESVTKIGNYAFSECVRLKTVYGATGSYAQTWAKGKGYTFVAQ